MVHLVNTRALGDLLILWCFLGLCHLDIYAHHDPQLPLHVETHWHRGIMGSIILLVHPPWLHVCAYLILKF